ncbi:MobA/MobL family protein [Roseivivax sp. GX 12232]|nr:MobA/MobL family protein [Roseivivax sp. GX 12232]
MTDDRTGQSYNYRRTQGLLGGGLVNWAGSAEDLWNTAEAAEKRINARVARELRPALPAELPLDDQRRLVHGFSCWLKDRYGVAVHYAIHAPTFRDKKSGKALWHSRGTTQGWKDYIVALRDPDRTNRNFHAHILFTTRDVDPETGVFGPKTRVLDNVKTGPEELTAIRAEWEKRTNAALRKRGSRARIDLRSYATMAEAGDAPEGLVAQPHLGPRETARVRKMTGSGDEAPASRRSEKRDHIRTDNAERWSCWMRLRALQREQARLEDSARVAAEREQERRKRAEVDRQRIAEAKTDTERQMAIDEATTLEQPRMRPLDPYAAAIATVMAEGVLAPETPDVADKDSDKKAANEFEQEIDPETFTSPDLRESTPEEARSKPVIRKPQRGNLQRSRG